MKRKEKAQLQSNPGNVVLVICDLDRIAVDCEERFRQAADSYEKGSSAYWQAALDPEMLFLDTPLLGAVEQLGCFAQVTQLCYLTSRPIDCHGKTVEFLTYHRYPYPGETVCRPVRKGLTTPRFKGLVVRALSYGLSVAFVNRHFSLATSKLMLTLLAWWSKLWRKRKVVLFIDDSEKNRQAITALDLEVYTSASLDEAAILLNTENAF